MRTPRPDPRLTDDKAEAEGPKATGLLRGGTGAPTQQSPSVWAPGTLPSSLSHRVVLSNHMGRG